MVGLECTDRGRLAIDALAAELNRHHDLRSLLRGCAENLLAVYRADDGLFPYSTSFDGDSFGNDYRKPEAVRYTFNSLLGLRRAARAGGFGIDDSQVDTMVAAANRRHAPAVTNRGDLGMVALLNADRTTDATEIAVAATALRELRRSLRPRLHLTINMQDLAWAIWGAAAAARQELDGAEEVGRAALAIVKERFVDRRSRLPRHSTRPYRRNLVSFGSFAYFLRAMHEAATTFGDNEARALFERGVQQSLALQGPLGEWPWLIHAHTGAAVDVYPLFSVHQDSMAMLFLLPALEQGHDVRPAIERSLEWCFGENELGATLYRYNPFFAARSIERAEGERRARRYARAIAYAATRRPGRFHCGNVRLNDECRSYHLGWLLFVWSEVLTQAA